MNDFTDRRWRFQGASGTTVLIPSETLWQPIETAPKDGTEVLLYEGHVEHTGIYTGAYHKSLGWIDNARGDLSLWPTHWMPLPVAPREMR